MTPEMQSMHNLKLYCMVWLAIWGLCFHRVSLAQTDMQAQQVPLLKYSCITLTNNNVDIMSLLLSL